MPTFALLSHNRAFKPLQRLWHRFALVLCSALLLAGCTHLPSASSASTNEPSANITPLNTAYDFILLDATTAQHLSIDQLAQALRDIDVVFIGEYHGNHASHLLQAQLQAALYQLRPNQVLSMEQFNRDHQTTLNQYLDSEIGEKTLIKEADAWSNYAASYRPLVEFAKRHFLPVYAANAPAQTVRCVGRQGQGYLDKLNPTERAQIAASPFYSDPNYEQKFNDLMQNSRHANAAQRQNSYFAQLVRDNTMAETLLNAHQTHPEAQILHLNGTFHSESHLGTVASLKQLAPHLSVAVISPVRVDTPQNPVYSPDDQQLGDYLYLVQPQPAEYVQPEKRRAAFKAMFKNADAKPCRP